MNLAILSLIIIFIIVYIILLIRVIKEKEAGFLFTISTIFIVLSLLFKFFEWASTIKIF